MAFQTNQLRIACFKDKRKVETCSGHFNPVQFTSPNSIWSVLKFYSDDLILRINLKEKNLTGFIRIDKDRVKPKQTSIRKFCLVFFFQNKNQPSSCDATENDYITFLQKIHTFCGFGICFKSCIASILNGQYR